MYQLVLKLFLILELVSITLFFLIIRILKIKNKKLLAFTYIYFTIYFYYKPFCFKVCNRKKNPNQNRTAFPLYVIANILTFMVLLYAGVMFAMTGVCMLVSTVIWATIKWGTQPMIIPFEDGYLETHYGPHFWLVIAGGYCLFVIL